MGVRVPPGCVLRLKKALYGLKQAPRAWYLLVTSVLIDFGFTKCVSDPCIYILIRGKDMVMVGVYVDDILIAGNNRYLNQRENGAPHLMKNLLIKLFL